MEDYRATEDSMRATLLTAQKMADSIVHEAEAKRDEDVYKRQVHALPKMIEISLFARGERTGKNRRVFPSPFSWRRWE